MSIYDYKNKYVVHDDGRVWSYFSKDFLTFRKSSGGYDLVSIEGKNRTVHRLVALCFVPNPNDYPEVNHKDGDKLNNSADNLEWCTRSQNLKHAFATGLQDNKGENHPSNKLYEADVLRIRAMYKEGGISHRGLATLYGVSKATVTGILNYKNWRHVA